MAKLQKSLKQRQRNSIRNNHHVAKLTPAEIRSLNNSASLSIASSQTSSKGTSPSTSRRGTANTPPASPDDGRPSEHRKDSVSRNSISRNSITNVPTPPHTPNGRRRPSQSSTHSHNHGHGHINHHGHSNGFIFAPRPRGHAQPTFMASNGISSRPSSSGSSTYRGLPTYRGPEVTRTGSMNMLQRPSPTIVANPLSNFSRPRQSLFSSSPERCRHDSGDMPFERTGSFNSRANSMPNVSAPSSRPTSPPRMSDSPVSMFADDTERFPAFDPNDPHNQPKDLSEDEDIQSYERDLNSTPQFDNEPSEQPVEQSASPELKSHEITPPESPKKDKGRRFTISSALFGGDKSATSGDHPDKVGKLKKNKKRTLSLTKGGENEHASLDPQATTPPAGGDTVDGAALENDDYNTHPAIRPLSLIIPTEDKGKGKETQSAPVYSRCSCCGKVKRPSGFTNELSPVLENENLRTNFSFEIERTSDSHGRRSSDASRGKFVPIIPMPVSATETRQASIEPYTTPTSPANHNHKSSLTSSPRRPKKHLDPPKFVRFASLHGRRSIDSTIISEEDETYEGTEGEGRPLMDRHVEEGDFHDVMQYDSFPHLQEPIIAKTTPVIDGPVTFPAREEKLSQLNNNNLAIPMDVAARRSSNETSSEPDVFFTPNRGTSPAVVETATVNQGYGQVSPPEQQQPTFGRVVSFHGLPEPNLGIDFKEFVIPPPTVSSGPVINEDRKWTPEVMAA